MNTRKFSLTLLVFLFVGNATGIPNYLESRIINGSPADIASTKHQVSIRNRYIDLWYFGLGHLCGGSLISPNVVLTAAHCLRDAGSNPIDVTSLTVVMGTLQRNVKDNNTLVYNVTKYLSHTNYNETTILNDIAFLFLDGNVPINYPTVEPIKLVKSKVPVGTLCQVTGWGLTENGTASDVLLTVDVPILDMNVCNEGYEGALGIFGQMCAGYMQGGSDACVGDSGGPLVCNSQLAGIVSFGKGCGDINNPGIYTDVLYFTNWITKSGAAKIKDLSMLTFVLLLILNFI